MGILKKLWQEEAGQGMTEYGLIIALVAVALIVTLGLFKDKIKELFDSINLDETPTGS